MEEVKRSTAYKIWMGDLVNGSYTRGAAQYDPGYVTIRNMNISRVNAIVSVIDKFSSDNYVNLVVDDGTGNLKLKSWGEDIKLLNEVNVGDLVLVIGKVKEYNGEIFLSPEIIRRIENPLWLKVRKLELLKLYGEIVRVETKNYGSSNESSLEEPMNTVIEEKVVDGFSSRDKVLKLISSLDSGDGADSENVVNSAGIVNVKELIENLIKEGEVFEIRKGKLKVL